jgi:hypothetical protein
MTWFIIIAVTNIMKICNILREARRLYNDKDVIFKRRLKSYQIWNKNIAHDRQKSGYRIARIVSGIILIRVITKLPNSEQSYKGKVKTHNYINRQNQSTTRKYVQSQKIDKPNNSERLGASRLKCLNMIVKSAMVSYARGSLALVLMQFII